MKHSPGPWTWADNNNLNCPHPDKPFFDSVIYATAEYDDGHYAEIHIEPADRMLIAAAPELLETLEELIKQLRIHAPGTALNNERFDSLGRKCYKVIAKARGENI